MTYKLTKLEGTIQLDWMSEEEVQRALAKLGVALQRRFDNVVVEKNTVNATADRRTFFFKGENRDEMKPFDRATFTISVTRNGARISYELGTRRQLQIALFLAVAFSASAGINRGTGTALLVGCGFAIGLLLYSTVVEVVHVNSWIRKTIS